MGKKFWKNKRVLVTGHEGFLGSWLTKMLVENGAAVIGVDIVKGRRHSVLCGIRGGIKSIRADISDLTAVKRIIGRYKPQIVFHLAAEAIVGRANKEPVNAFKANIEGTWNIMEACRGRKFVQAIVAASSDKAYGSHKILPYKEDAELKGDHPYDASKSCADLLCYTYWNTYKVPVCITRCGNIYGGGDTNYSRVAPDAVRCAIKGRKFVIRSDGRFTRDYVYVEDIARGYILLAEKAGVKGLFGQAFNFSDENPMTVIELVKKIFRTAGRKPDYDIRNVAKYEIKHQYLSSAKARRVLGWKPECTLEEGLQKTVDWYRENI